MEEVFDFVSLLLPTCFFRFVMSYHAIIEKATMMATKTLRFIFRVSTQIVTIESNQKNH